MSGTFSYFSFVHTSSEWNKPFLQVVSYSSDDGFYRTLKAQYVCFVSLLHPHCYNACTGDACI